MHAKRNDPEKKRHLSHTNILVMMITVFLIDLLQKSFGDLETVNKACANTFKNGVAMDVQEEWISWKTVSICKLTKMREKNTLIPD